MAVQLWYMAIGFLYQKSLSNYLKIVSLNILDL